MYVFCLCDEIISGMKLSLLTMWRIENILKPYLNWVEIKVNFIWWTIIICPASTYKPASTCALLHCMHTTNFFGGQESHKEDIVCSNIRNKKKTEKKCSQFHHYHVFRNGTIGQKIWFFPIGGVNRLNCVFKSHVLFNWVTKQFSLLLT